jgi:hypothetical protein
MAGWGLRLVFGVGVGGYAWEVCRRVGEGWWFGGAEFDVRGAAGHKFFLFFYPWFTYIQFVKENIRKSLVGYVIASIDLDEKAVSKYLLYKAVANPYPSPARNCSCPLVILAVTTREIASNAPNAYR